MSDKRIRMAEIKREELVNKLEKVKGTPREEEFKIQIEKVDELINHLKNL